MIEDDDAFKQQEGSGPLEDEGKHSRVFLCLVLAWIVWTIVLSVIFIPRVKTAVEESGVVELIEESGTKGEAAKERNVQAAFLTSGGFEIFDIETRRRGSDAMHDSIEALISDYAPVEAGAISLLNEETRLIGLTESQGIVYVNFSEEFLESDSFRSYTAADQVRRTLLNFSGVEKVVILVEGEIQNL